MLTFYIDEPLSALEEAIVIEQINTISSNKTYQLEFKQLTEQIPANDSDLTHVQIIERFEDMLIKMEVPLETQSAFILPKGGLSWGMLLQMAFKKVSNYYPLVIQPWEMGKDKIHKRRQHILVTDINSAMPS